ncbi:MAG TPA: penicillin-binding protein 2 [Actinomycetota bacterium]
MSAGTAIAPRRRSARGRPPRTPAGRLVALLLLLVVGFSGILVRLVQLQIRDAPSYRALARDQRVRTITLPAARGSLLDRNREELALSLPAKAVYADPRLVSRPAATARIVADTLELDFADVYAALHRPGPFVYLARGVELHAAAALEAKHLPGIGFLSESHRYYPAKELAPQVLGFVGVDGTGLAGLELEYQKLLAGRPGREVVEADPRGLLIPQGANVDVPPVPGEDLVLSIDREIQYRAQAALAQAVRRNHAKGGTVIVMDPASGGVLGMADYPWFDPNRFAEGDPQALRNRAVTDAYEPGSVNKVITAAAAIQENVIKLKQRLKVSSSYRLYSKTFHDVHAHPKEPMTLADIIAYSSNVGTIEVASMLGRARFYSYLQRFGLTHRTGVGFPGESAGLLPSPEQWSGTSMGTIPLGQGIAVTPLQMASVYATIANGGLWVQPRLVSGIVGADGKVRRAAPSRTRRVISPETAQTVTRMLAYAVRVGTGKEAQIPGFWVAGKTGTARKVNEDGTGYSHKYVASFIGFAPAANPAVVVAAVLDEPSTVYGGIAAAPLFRDVAHFAMARLRVPPAPRLPAPPHAVPAR